MKWAGSEKVNDNVKTGHRKAWFKFNGLHGCKQDHDQRTVTAWCHLFDCYIMNTWQILAIDFCTDLRRCCAFVVHMLTKRFKIQVMAGFGDPVILEISAIYLHAR